MTTYYKAVREDGRSFTGSVDYLAGLTTGEPVTHPNPVRGDSDASHYLSISVEPGDCTGFDWPARLFEVKPAGRAWTPHKDYLPNKRAAVGVRVVRELPAHLLLGPQGESVVAIIDRYATMTDSEKRNLYSAREDSWRDAFYAVAGGGRAGRAGLSAAQYALDGQLDGWAGGSAAYGAALAVLLRHTLGKEDGITQAEYNLLTAPWVIVTSQKAHPEDEVF